MELDELIGEIRREAARRRAAPDFPLELEAVVAADLDSLGPVGVAGSGADLARILARLRQLAETSPTPDATDPLTELAALTAAGINALAARLDHLQRRVPRASDLPAAGAGAEGPHPDLRSRGIDALLAATGKVLVAGPDAAGWVDALISGGVDVTGIDPTLRRFEDGGRLRGGTLSDFLASVGEGDLAGVLIVGPLTSTEVDRHAQLCADLARVSACVVVCAEAPWAWRLRLGDATADLEDGRPLSPETWLEGLAQAGLVGSGSYSPDGRSYLLEARRSGSAVT